MLLRILLILLKQLLQVGLLLVLNHNSQHVLESKHLEVSIFLDPVLLSVELLDNYLSIIKWSSDLSSGELAHGTGNKLNFTLMELYLGLKHSKMKGSLTLFVGTVPIPDGSNYRLTLKSQSIMLVLLSISDSQLILDKVQTNNHGLLDNYRLSLKKYNLKRQWF